MCVCVCVHACMRADTSAVQVILCVQVNHLEPWEKGSRKTAGQTGMCGGVSIVLCISKYL